MYPLKLLTLLAHFLAPQERQYEIKAVWRVRQEEGPWKYRQLNDEYKTQKMITKELKFAAIGC